MHLKDKQHPQVGEIKYQENQPVDEGMINVQYRWLMQLLESLGSNPSWQPVVKTMKDRYRGVIRGHLAESNSEEELKQKLLTTLVGVIAAETRIKQRPEVSQWLEQKIDRFLLSSKELWADIQSRKAAKSVNGGLPLSAQVGLGSLSAAVATVAAMPTGALYAQEQPPTATTSEIDQDQSNQVETSNQQVMAVAQGFAEFEQLQQHLLERGATDLPEGILVPSTLLNAAELPQVCQMVTGVDEGKPRAASTNFIDLSRPAINPASGDDAYLAPADPFKDFARLDAPPSAYGVWTDRITIAFQISSRNALAGNGGFTAYVIAKNEQGERIFEYSDMYALQAVPEGRWNVLPVDFDLPAEQRVVGGGVVVVLENGQVIMIDDMNIFQDSSEGCLITLYLPDISGYKDPTLDKESPYYGWFKVPATPEQHQFLTDVLKMPADKIVKHADFWLYNPKEVSVRLQTEQGELRFELSSLEDADLLRDDLQDLHDVNPSSVLPAFILIPRWSDVPANVQWGQVLRTAGEGALVRLGVSSLSWAEIVALVPGGTLLIGLSGTALLLSGDAPLPRYAGATNKEMFTRKHIFPIALPEGRTINEQLSSTRPLVPVLVEYVPAHQRELLIQEDWQLQIFLGDKGDLTHSVLLVSPEIGQKYLSGLLLSVPRTLEDHIQREDQPQTLLPTALEASLGRHNYKKDLTFMLPPHVYRDVYSFLVNEGLEGQQLENDYFSILGDENEESTYLTPDGKERWVKNPPELGKDIELGHDIYVENNGLRLWQDIIERRLANNDVERAKDAAQKLLEHSNGVINLENEYQRQLDDEGQQIEELKQKGNLTAEEQKLLEVLEKHVEEAAIKLNEERAITQECIDSARQVITPPPKE